MMIRFNSIWTGTEGLSFSGRVRVAADGASFGKSCSVAHYRTVVQKGSRKGMHEVFLLPFPIPFLFPFPIPFLFPFPILLRSVREREEERDRERERGRPHGPSIPSVGGMGKALR